MQDQKKTGWYEVQDASGVWHRVTDVQATAYRSDGVPTRYQNEGMQVRQAIADALRNQSNI